MELRLGQMSITKEYACDKEYFNASTPTFTLVGRSQTTSIQETCLFKANVPWYKMQTMKIKEGFMTT